MWALVDQLIVFTAVLLAAGWLWRRTVKARRAAACGSALCGGCQPSPPSMMSTSYKATPLVRLGRH
jgi:hypothetical protein